MQLMKTNQKTVTLKNHGSEYNNIWKDYLRSNPNATRIEVLNFGKELGSARGFSGYLKGYY